MQDEMRVYIHSGTLNLLGHNKHLSKNTENVLTYRLKSLHPKAYTP